MNFYQVFVIGLCFTILENGVTGNYCENYPANPTFGLLEPPFYFGYTHFRADYNMILTLKNVSRHITAIFVTAAETDGPVSRYEWKRYNYEGEQFRICGPATSSKVTIGLELYSFEDLCATRLVSEAKDMRTIKTFEDFSKYNRHHFCLNIQENSCAIEIDLRHDCIGYPKIHRKKKYTTPKPRQNNSTALKPAISHTPKKIPDIPDKVRTTTRKPNRRMEVSITTTTASTSTTPASTSTTPASTSRKPAISYTPKDTQNVQNTSRKIFVTPKPAQNHTHNSTNSIPRNISEADNRNTVLNTSEATLNTSIIQQNARNISVTTNATQVTTDTSNAVALTSERNKYITISIASAVSVMVLILLVVVIRKCCWTKRNPAGSSKLLTNDLGDSPFYLNMLFRKECDREIEQTEQNHYEEINDH